MNFEDKEATREKVEIVMRQTDYSEDVALEKLREFNGDHIRVIKAYMGIAEKKELPVVSVNQEIYRQLRHRLDDSMRDYNKKQREKQAKELFESE